MNKDLLIKDVSIKAVKDTLKQGIFKWKDTGKLVTYNKLIDVLGFIEPISSDQAIEIYRSLKNDPRISKTNRFK